MCAIPTCGIVGTSVQADPSQYCSVMLPREMISRPKIMCMVKDSTNVMNRYDFVLRQVCSESGKTYFGRNQFEIWIDNQSSCWPLQEVALWLETMVGDFATHLRDVRVHVGALADKRHFLKHVIQARFHQNHGLQITGSDDSWHLDDQDEPPQDEPFHDMPAYVATLEKNRIARGQKGEVIVDFSTADVEAFFRAWYGPPRQRQLRQIAAESDENYDGSEDEWDLFQGDGQFGLFHRYDHRGTSLILVAGFEEERRL